MESNDLMNKINSKVYGFLERVLPPVTGRVSKAIRYSLLENQGHGWRGALTYSLGKDLGVNDETIIPISASVEGAQAVSLMYDDIHDKSRKRREKPSCWRIVGVAATEMGGLDLLAYGRDWIRSSGLPVEISSQIIERGDIATHLIINGQGMDMDPQNLRTTADILKMYAGKTSALYVLAVESAALAGNSPSYDRQFLRDLAELLGTVYQIGDDLGDRKKDRHKKRTLIDIPGVGMEGAREIWHEKRQELEENLVAFSKTRKIDFFTEVVMRVLWHHAEYVGTK